MKIKNVLYDTGCIPTRLYILYENGIIAKYDNADKDGKFVIDYLEKVKTNNVKQICCKMMLFDDGTVHDICGKYIANNVKQIDGTKSNVYGLTNENSVIKLSNSNENVANNCKYMSNYFYIGSDNMVYRNKDGSKCVDNNGDPIRNIKEGHVAFGDSLGLLIDIDNNIYYSDEDYFTSGYGPKYASNKSLIDSNNKIFKKSKLKAKKIFCNGTCIIALLPNGDVGKISIDEKTCELKCDIVLKTTPGGTPIDKAECFVLSCDFFYRGELMPYVYNYKTDYVLVRTDGTIVGYNNDVKKVIKIFMVKKQENGYDKEFCETFKLLKNNTPDTSWRLCLSDMEIDNILSVIESISKNSIQKTTISTSDSHTIYLKDDGTIMTCGENDCGQLGLNDTKDRNVLTKVSGINNVKQISTGVNHSMILYNDGTIATCGNNRFGQLGLGNNTDKHVFTKVPGIKDVEQISCGGNTSTIKLSNGTIMTCGDNARGQLCLADNKNRNTFTKVNM